MNVLSKEEKTNLNKKAESLILSSGQQFENTHDSYDTIRENEFIGFAHFYLHNSSDPESDIYKKLIEIDSRLGTTDSEQLYGCLSTNSDFIKVWKN